jgi:starch-binding outer membrane protein, SusD/RagB family
MKKINIALIILTATIFTACEKALEVEPKQSIDASTALENDQDVNSLVVGGYATMGGGSLYGTNLLMVPDLLGSNGVCTWRGTFQSPRQITNKTMTRDNADANLIWTAAYDAINTANIVLSNLDKVKDADLKTQLEGEALFIRGIMHFELVRLYGLPWGATPGNTHPGVVIKTKPTNTEAEAFEKHPRNTVKEVYDQVITDLSGAAALLPDVIAKRANRFAALAFLSRVYLAQGNYGAALTTADDVIQSGLFKMNASIAAVFDNKNTAESIWEIQQNEQNNAGTSNNGMATFYASLPGIGRADVRLVNSFLDNYEANDLRRSEWYYLGTGARPADTANGVFNRYVAKWKSFSQNLPVIRIAEMHLTRAECNLRLGGAPVGATPGEDLAEIKNPVRTNTTAPAVPTLDDVLEERFIELAFEGHRIHDLRRLRLPTGTFEWNSDRLVFPIPQREIDATSGVIVQNPGY